MWSRISRGGFVLRKWQGRMEGFAQYGLLAPGGAGAVSRSSVGLSRLAGIALVVLLIAFLTLVFGVPEHLGLLAVGATAVVTTPKTDTEPKKPAKIREMEANLKSLAKELEAGQIEMTAGPITEERGQELESKAHEMEELQGHLDRYNKIAGIVTASKKVDRITLPGEDGHRIKSVTTTPGHVFVASEAFAAYKRGEKQGWSSKVSVGRRLGQKLRLHGEEAVAFERKAYDPAMLSSLGDDAIVQVDRDPEIVRFEEPEVLTIRDVFNVSPTSSDSIKYVQHVSTDRAAKSQSPRRGGLKEFLKIAFTPKTVTTQTVAVLSKVTEQDIDDAPRLVGIINGEMVLDSKVEEERQLLWGGGDTVDELLGLFDPTNLVPEFARAELDDTTIDTIRRMRTDLRKKHVTPNFVLIDPLDWETVETAKGSDKHYIWGLISDLRGPRIWSLRVVESDAMTNVETGERRITVGDGIRGATIYDRMAIQLAVGFMDDDFGRNLRTLKAEERLALAVKRPFAFEFAVTAEGES